MARSLTPRAALLTATFAAAISACSSDDTCREEEVSGTALRFDEPSVKGEFFAHPWPSDARRRSDGRPLFRGFPNPTGSSTLEEYLETMEAHTKGFGRNAAVTMAFSGPLDPESLPKTPADAAREGSSLALIDVDPRSPERGRRVPLWVRYGRDRTVYLPENHVIALPPFGVPLRDGTTYALIGSSSIRDSAGKPIEAPKSLHNALRAECKEQSPASMSKLLEPLVRFFEDSGANAEDVRAATVFTTQDVVGEMRAIGDAARAQPAPEVHDLAIAQQTDFAVLVSGWIDMPAFQEGSPPYSGPADGGAMAFDANGAVRVTHKEKTGVGFVIPKGEMPEAGWPVVLYSHGTGGDWKSVWSSKVAGKLARLGIAVVSYDQTLHGPRDPTGRDPEITFFNLFNIVAGRDNVRQGGADCVVMTSLIASGMSLPADVTGLAADARFDASRIGFLGHSQGGLVGAPFVAIEPRIKAAVFSGTSGLLSITLQERKDPLDFAGLLRSLLTLPPEEVLDDMHPLLNVMQSFIEPADPINYAPSFLADPPGGSPRDVLFVEGFLDFASPARGHEALAAAARAPLVAPAHRNPYASELIGLQPLEAPVSANADSAGQRVTIGLIQYPEQTHFPIFDDPDANRRYVEFLRSSLIDGRAQILASE